MGRRLSERSCGGHSRSGSRIATPTTRPSTAWRTIKTPSRCQWIGASIKLPLNRASFSWLMINSRSLRAHNGPVDARDILNFIPNGPGEAGPLSACSERNHAEPSFSSPLRGERAPLSNDEWVVRWRYSLILPRRERALSRRVGGLQLVLCCGDQILGFGDVADGPRSLRLVLKRPPLNFRPASVAS